jgi:tetratricopeptide (TPR) repeat protein
MDTTQALELCSLAEAADRGLIGLDAAEWRRRLGTSVPDVRSALEWLLERDRAAALRMATALAAFWRISGQMPEGRFWLDRTLAVADANDPALPRALYEDGMLAFWQADATAMSLFERSLESATRLHDPTGEAVAICGMARVALREGDLDRARRHCRDALDRVRGTDDLLGRSNALHVLGVSAQMRGDFIEARGFMNERMQLARQLGNFSSVASEASNLSVVERQLGNFERAKELALEALRLSDRRGDEWSIPFDLNSLAGIAAAGRDFERAAKLLGAAAALMDRMAMAWPPDETTHFDRTRASAEAALAPEVFRAAWSEGGQMSASQAVEFASAAP